MSSLAPVSDWLRARDWEEIQANVAAVVVSLGAGIISWDAEIEVAAAANVRPQLTSTYPLGIDGLLFMGLLAAHRLRRSTLRRRGYTWVLIAYATAISLACNALHSRSHGGVLMLPFAPWGGYAASSVPPLAWAGTIHLWIIRKRARDEGDREAPRQGFVRRLISWLSGGHSGRPAESEQTVGPTQGHAEQRRPPAPATRRSPTQATRGGSAGGSRRSAAEVREMVRSARERLTAELGREPDDTEVATRVTAAGHPLSASRTRLYLAELRSEGHRPELADNPEEVVVG
jgi:Protein of unknown function (DUF2637)